MNTNESVTPASPAPKTDATNPVLARAQKRKSRAEGRKKRKLKLKTNKEFAKQYFEAKGKRSTDKKSAFRKKKSKKK